MRSSDYRVWWAGFLLAWAPVSVAWAWEIADFQARVALREDATATITETIVADFTGESRRGIFRDIPIHYTDRAGQHFQLRMEVLDVTDAAGHPRPYALESAGRSRRIRIGDPQVRVTGLQTYRIVYQVTRGAVRFFPNHDECYWNLTGNEWAVPLRRVRAEIRLPATASDVRAVAYAGVYQSTARLGAAELTILSDRVLLTPAQSFGPYEGLTVVVGWETGIVRPPSAGQVVWWWLADNWVYGLPLVVLLGMVWLWHARGRDPRLGSQVVHYEPPEGLAPAEAGTLLDQRAHLRDITSTVIDLAVRGYLRIEPVTATFLGRTRTSDYRLESLQPWDGDHQLKPYERMLLRSLFGASRTVVEISDLRQEFYKHLPNIRDTLYRELVNAGYLDSHPEHVRTRYLMLGAVLGGVMWIALSASQPWHHVGGVATVVAPLLSALAVIGFSQAMPRRTLKGARQTDRLAGFLEFLRRADQDRLRRVSDPALFERFLPYALAFGVADRWARAFEGLGTAPPSWYAGEWDTFSPRAFCRDLAHSTSSMGEAFTSTPRGSSGSWGGSGFGGGGFSGGGGGGGGGGAW